MSDSQPGSSDSCENCNANFSLFKRRKICSVCKMAYCQSCVNRIQQSPLSSHTSTNNSGSSSSSSNNDRICLICQSICSPQTTIDDLLKLKLKHLRMFLAGVSTVSTAKCKEKRDLAELVMIHRPLLSSSANNSSSRTSSSSRPSSQQPPPPTAEHTSSSINDTLNNIMTNVFDFVNSSTSSTTSTTNASSNGRSGGDASSQQQASNANNSSGGSSSSSGFTNAIPVTNNLSNLFTMIGEHVPNVLNQTFNTNRFTFNNSNISTTNNNNNNNNASSFSFSHSGAAAAAPAHSSQQQSRDESQHHQPSASSEGATASATSTFDTSTQQQAQPRRRASLSDIHSEEDIEQLNIKQIKEILANNFVEYKGCCEKKELLEKVRRLYASHLENKRLERELLESERQSKSTSSLDQQQSHAEETMTTRKVGVDETDMCKICMETLIDCVLLDCGHMVSCIKCGKRLAECPICRQNVVRVIRVFKS